MSEAHNWKSYGFLVLVLILQVTVYSVVYANVPIARMVVCFLYLMFVPGIAILKLLEMKNLDTAEKVLFSTGLSIVFLMLIGLFINEIGRLAFTNPLSLNLLLISINTAVLLISLVVTRREGSSLPRLPQLKRSEWLFSILLTVSLFVLGSYATFMVNTPGGSFLSSRAVLLLIIAVSIAVSSVFLWEKVFSSRIYPLILFVIFISMLTLFGALITKYIAGTGDGWIEFQAFRLTQTKGFWDSAAVPSPYSGTLFPTYSMASVTILPVIFSTFSGLDSSLVAKLLYVLIVSFLALGAYKLYQTQTESKAAFLATFFLITISIGKGLGSYKQQVAQVFYVSLFLLLFKKGISPSKKSILFIILGAGLVLSHYALAYIFLITFVIAFLILAIMDYRKTGRFLTRNTRIPATLVLILLTVTFSWYIYVNSSTTFNLLTQEVTTVTSNLNQFFNPASRGTALQGLGATQNPTIFNSISSALFYLTEVLLVLGFIILWTSKNRNMGFSTEYKVVATLNIAIIAINVLLPQIANTFLMERFYQTTLIILAPLAVLGGKTIFERMLKPHHRKFAVSLLAFMVFIPLFFFQTGFVYEVAKVQSYSVPLSMYRWNALNLYEYFVDTQEVSGAQWLQEYANLTSIFIYSDTVFQPGILTGYGLIEPGRVFELSNTTRPTSQNFIYLSNIGLISEGYVFNASEISPILQGQNKIYSNGECEIYKGCGP
jgi:uncharacterized membrane protein